MKPGNLDRTGPVAFYCGIGLANRDRDRYTFAIRADAYELDHPCGRYHFLTFAWLRLANRLTRAGQRGAGPLGAQTPEMAETRGLALDDIALTPARASQRVGEKTQKLDHFQCPVWIIIEQLVSARIANSLDRA